MRFSIVIPTHNRNVLLRRCLEGVAALNYDPGRFEVVIVDDGSSEPCESAVLAFRERIDIRSLRQPNSGPAKARNTGAASASGDMLAFLDDDCVPEPDWLQRLNEAASAAPDAMIGGSTVVGCPENIYSMTDQIVLDVVRAWAAQGNNALQFLPSNNLAIPAASFRALGGFDSGMTLAGGEDREFCARWLSSGRSFANAPKARILHYHPQTLRSFLAMHFRYGRGAAMLHARRSTTPFVYAKRELYQQLLAAARQPDGSRVLYRAGLIAATQLTAGLGYLVQAGIQLRAAPRAGQGGVPPMGNSPGSTSYREASSPVIRGSREVVRRSHDT
jgi:glycosyltransferase involved in cell wall biosynthesis